MKLSVLPEPTMDVAKAFGTLPQVLGTVPVVYTVNPLKVMEPPSVSFWLIRLV